MTTPQAPSPTDNDQAADRLPRTDVLHAHDHDGRSSEGHKVPTPSAGWTGTIIRIVFGLVFALDAYLKWQPDYRGSFLQSLKQTAQGQPNVLHGWFHFWINLQAGDPMLWATITGLTETALAVVLLLGVARRVSYLGGAAYMIMVWAVGEGFGGPYGQGNTDIGTAIPYILLFVALLVFAPPARREHLSLDKALEKRIRWWRLVAEPHAVDRVHGAPIVEPVVVGERRHPWQAADHQAAS
ncbi:MAG: DoxX family protein [Solirubrobacteraceae bacterium]